MDQNYLIGDASLIAQVEIEKGRTFFVLPFLPAIISKGLKFSLQNYRMLSLTFVSFLIYLKLLSRQLSLLKDHYLLVLWLVQ